jgi:hypothetical protein
MVAAAWSASGACRLRGVSVVQPDLPYLASLLVHHQPDLILAAIGLVQRCIRAVVLEPCAYIAQVFQALATGSRVLRRGLDGRIAGKQRHGGGEQEAGTKRFHAVFIRTFGFKAVGREKPVKRPGACSPAAARGSSRVLPRLLHTLKGVHSGATWAARLSSTPLTKTPAGHRAGVV